MRKVARQTLLSFVVVLFVLVSLAFVFLVQEVATGGGLETKEPTARHPLAKMTAAQYRGKTDEVFATLEAGVGLNDAVDLGLFEGFDSQMTLEAAKKDLGPPSGEWDDPFCRRLTPFYQRPEGRVSLCRYELEVGHRWDTIGYPHQSDHDSVFRDERLPQQLVPRLPVSGGVNVHLGVEGGVGAVTVKMTRESCVWIVLSERD